MSKYGFTTFSILVPIVKIKMTEFLTSILVRLWRIHYSTFYIRYLSARALITNGGSRVYG